MITIVDYQMGNLRSVQKAVQRAGVDARISSDAHEIAAAEKLILPGVGAFGDAIGEIRSRDLEKPIKDFIASGRPFLGICLGLQMLFEQGLEHGTHEGLGVLAGDVVAFDLPSPWKVPHMGWNTVTPGPAGGHLDIAAETHFYFVHSYHVRPADPRCIALSCDYGHPFCAAVVHENILATQFHPEKSQADGLRLMHAFVTGQTHSHAPAIQ